MSVNAITATAANPWFRGMATNTTNSGTPAPAPTITTPATVDGTSVTVAGTLNELHLRFFGIGADDSTATYYVYGWRPMRSAGVNDIWTPTFLMSVVATFSTQVGVAGSAQLATERDADTIVVTAGQAVSARYLAYSPTNNTTAVLLTDVFGYPRVTIYPKVGTATSANLAYSFT